MDFNKLRVGFWIFIFVTMSVKCLSQPLSPISPKNGLVINNDSILLRWNKMVNAISYQLKYTTDSTFNSNVNTVNVGLQTTYWLTPLSSNTTYYWRVEGFNGVNTIIGIARRFTNFKPTDLVGCALWLRADTGITLSGNNVQSWADASVNNFNIVQSTASERPLLQNNTIAGYPSLSFDGNDILVINNFPYDVNNNVFAVAKKTNAAVNHGNITSGSYFDLEMQTFRCALKLGSVVGLYDAVNWSQISLKRKSGASKVFFNGIQSGITNTDALNPITPGNFALGNRNPSVNSPSPFRGNICEIIINTTSMSDVEFFNSQNYLLDKYTESLNLGYDTIIENNFCSFTLSANAGFTNFVWSTGDTTSTILVSSSGQYVLQARDLFNRIQTDTIMVLFPNFNQLINTNLCVGTQLNWNTNLGTPFSFLWQDGSTQSSFNITQGGSYYVKVTDTLGCILNSDTVLVGIDYFSDEVLIGNDTSLCSGNTIQLQQGAATAINYLWSDGSNNDSLIINNGGLYWIEVSNINNCIGRDTILINLTGIAPSADFESQNVCIGLPTQFNDLSTASSGDTIVGWEWNFNSLGAYSYSQNPTFTYPNPGNYIVSLKAIAQTGCAGVINKVVNVYDHPDINFLVTNNCNGKSCEFNDLTNTNGGTISGWIWNFNDPSSANNVGYGNQVNHIYNQEGIYEVSLFVNTIEGCVDSLHQTINIKPSPIAQLEHSSLCVGDTINFKDISLIPFPQQNIFRKWIFNDTIIINDIFEPTFTYSQAGVYPLTLCIMASNGCRDTVQMSLNIDNKPNVGFFYAKPCVNSDVLFIDSSSCENCIISSWNWTVDGHNIGNNSTTSYFFSNSGEYNVSLQAINTAGCIGETIQNVQINQNPISSFSIDETFGSPPLNLLVQNLSDPNLLYLWSFGTGDESFDFEPEYTYLDTGSFDLQLIVTDSLGCTGISSSEVKILLKKVDVSIESANTQSVNGYLSSELLIANLGTTRVNKFEIRYSSNGFVNNIIENWEGVLRPGEFLEYQLKSTFMQPESNNKADFICFEIQNIDQGEDNNIQNNNACTIIDNKEFQFTGLFPNPTEDILNLNFISATESVIAIDIYDSKGALIKHLDETLKKGVNRVTLETFTLMQGLYNCRVTFNSKYESKKFLKLNHQN